MTRIAVTGGAGFAGSALIRKLLKNDYEIVAIDTTGPNQAELLRDVIESEKLTYKWKAIHDLHGCDFDGCEIVIHLAAEANVPISFESPGWVVYQNVNGTVSLLESCKNVMLDKFIYAGSGAEWGQPLYLPIDEDHPLTPHNPYAFSKAAAELACWAWYRAYKIPVTLMSNGIVIGPNMRKDGFVYKWLKNIILGKPVILEGGDQTRDVTYIEDAIDAWIKVVKAPGEKVTGQKFHISFGEEKSLEEILEICFEVTGKKTNIIKVPHRPGEIGFRENCSIAKARSVLGYFPKLNCRESIRLSYEWINSLPQKDL